MHAIGTTALALALILFVGFFANVLVGAVGNGEVLDDVEQMILLLVSATAFVVGILVREAEARYGEPRRSVD